MSPPSPAQDTCGLQQREVRVLFACVLESFPDYCPSSLPTLALPSSLKLSLGTCFPAWTGSSQTPAGLQRTLSSHQSPGDALELRNMYLLWRQTHTFWGSLGTQPASCCRAPGPLSRPAPHAPPSAQAQPAVALRTSVSLLARNSPCRALCPQAQSAPGAPHHHNPYTFAGQERMEGFVPQTLGCSRWALRPSDLC